MRSGTRACWCGGRTASEWEPVPGPSLERVLVAGWQPQNGTTRGYWWFYEDETDEHGRPIDYPCATMWRRFPAPPPLPTPSTSEKTDVE